MPGYSIYNKFMLYLIEKKSVFSSFVTYVDFGKGRRGSIKVVEREL